MKKRLLLLPLLAGILAFSGCAEGITKKTVFAMDTVIDFSVKHEDAGELIGECREIITELEKKLSRTDEASEIFRFNHSTASPLSEETVRLLEVAEAGFELSLGLFDPTVAPLVELWNIAHPQDGWTPPSEDAIADALSLVNMNALRFENGVLYKENAEMAIDLGGIGKGWALGRCAQVLRDAGAVGTVSFGGNVATVGERPAYDASGADRWTVGIKNPLAPDTLIGTLKLPGNAVVSVSGSYERYVDYEGVRYHHIIDPRTGYPADSDLASAAVVILLSDDADADEFAFAGALGDMLSTTFFIMGSAEGLFDHSHLGILLIKKDGTVLTNDFLEGMYVPLESQ